MRRLNFEREGKEWDEWTIVRDTTFLRFFVSFQSSVVESVLFNTCLARCRHTIGKVTRTRSWRQAGPRHCWALRGTTRHYCQLRRALKTGPGGLLSYQTGRQAIRRVGQRRPTGNMALFARANKSEVRKITAVRLNRCSFSVAVSGWSGHSVNAVIYSVFLCIAVGIQVTGSQYL